MSRSAITRHTFVANGPLADPAPTAIDAANGMRVAAGNELDKIVLRVRNTTAGARAATIRAGTDHPAFRRGLGDRVGSSLAQNTSEWIGPFECARFRQPNGEIWIDFASGMTGEVTAFIIPRTV